MFAFRALSRSSLLIVLFVAALVAGAVPSSAATGSGLPGPAVHTGYADGATKPGIGDVIVGKRETVPNLAVLPVGAGGKTPLFSGVAGTVRPVANISGYQLAASAPAVTGLSAHSALVTGGGTVTITGTGFVDVRAVGFDDQPAISYTVLSPTTITAVIPPDAAHTVYVLISAAGGTSAAVTASRFTYTAPADTYHSTLQPSAGTFVQSADSVLSVVRSSHPLNPAVTWTINAAAGTAAPAVGDHYLLNPGNTVYPGGLFGTVTAAVLPFNGANVITVASTPLDQGIEQSSTDFTGPIGDPAGGTPASAGPTNIGPDHVTTNNRAPAATPNVGTTVGFPPISASELVCDKSGASPQGSVSIQLVNVKAHVQADAGRVVTSPFVTVWASYETKVTYRLSARVATTCTVPTLWQMLHKRVFAIGASPYTISISPNFSATFSTPGTINVTDHSYHVSGFVSNPDGSIRLIDGQSADPAAIKLSGELQSEFFAGADLQVGVLDRFGSGITTGIGATSTAQAATGSPPTVCFSTDPFVRNSLSAYLPVWVKKWKLQAFHTDRDLPGVHSCLAPPTAPATPTASPVITNSLPAGTVGVPYSTHLATADNRTGGWTLVAGKLPAGLTLTPTGGVAGTPIAAGDYRPIIRVTDTSNRATTATISLPVAAAATNAPGTVYAWGDNLFGGLGDGTTGDSITPVRVGGVTGVTGVTAIAAGEYSGYALRGLGTVYAWGANANGELGDGSTTDSSIPVRVRGLTGVTAIAGGFSTGYAVRSDGTVYAWGDNGYGGLGDGTMIGRSTPVRVRGLTGVTAVAGGAFSGYAVRSDGTAYAWGDNGYGGLGDGTMIDRSTPVRVRGLTGVTAVAGGAFSGYALRSDGTVYAWGMNAYGQLGDGTTTDSSTPVQVNYLTGVTAIAAGEYSGYALRSDGTVYAWGYNATGELGDGTTTNRTTPVRVNSLTGLTGLTGVTALAGGLFNGYALRSDGTVDAWGYNGHGQLGSGLTRNYTSTPVQVNGLNGLKGLTAIAGGGDSGYALQSQ